MMTMKKLIEKSRISLLIASTTVVAAMTFAAIDVEKEQDKGNDGHGSKVIMLPFDGAALNSYLHAN
jgi:hypothetical protein